MPQVKVTNSKGLVQSGGKGFTVSNGGTIMNTGAAQLGPSAVIFGKGSAQAAADPFTQSSTQLWPLGTELIYGERKFRYCLANGACNAGVLLQSPVLVNANHRDLDVEPSSAGDYSVTVTLGATAATLNQYKDGFIHINDDTADVNSQGHLLKIRSNPAADASATLALTLYDPVVVALPTTGVADLIQNPCFDVIIAPAAETGALVGVTPIETTDDYYFWAQTSGICSVLQAGTVVLGHTAVRSGGTAGACAPATDNLLQEIGDVSVVNGSGDNCVVNLNLP
jgi:hypothetical protein